MYTTKHKKKCGLTYYSSDLTAVSDFIQRWYHILRKLITYKDYILRKLITYKDHILRKLITCKDHILRKLITDYLGYSYRRNRKTGCVHKSQDIVT